MKHSLFILKVLLILLTVFQLWWLGALFFEKEIAYSEYGQILSMLLYLYGNILTAVCIWYTWQRLPIANNAKRDKTWMLIILGFFGLGIIALWLWLPNKREMEKWRSS